MIITTANHKSGRMASLKTKLLPIIVPARGIDGSLWAEDAVAAMQAVGCSFEGPLDGPLMRAPANGIGDFMQRGLRSSELTQLLRRFLDLEDPAPGCQDEVVSSHSMKATLLAWSARYGLSPQTRSMLGRHSSCLSETFAIYSRDLACAPVAELQGMIDSICNGDFRPDERRSEFFRSATAGDEPCGESLVKREYDDVHVVDSDIETVDEPLVAPPEGGSFPPPRGEADGADSPLAGSSHDCDVASDVDSESSTIGSHDESSANSDAVEPPARVKRFRARIPQDESWYVHSKSHLIHRCTGEMQNMVRLLVCGKRLTEAYVRCTEATAWNTLCRSCNRR